VRLSDYVRRGVQMRVSGGDYWGNHVASLVSPIKEGWREVHSVLSFLPDIIPAPILL
jgi:hypothetical protein